MAALVYGALDLGSALLELGRRISVGALQGTSKVAITGAKKAGISVLGARSRVVVAGVKYSGANGSWALVVEWSQVCLKS